MELQHKEGVKNKIRSEKNKIEYYTSHSSPHGITFGAWTAKWWKWFFSIEKNRNPVFDNTGLYANEKQFKPVWFLAGTWVGEVRKYPIRKCSIPSAVSVLFPVLNCEVNPLEYPHLRSKKDMKNHILHDRSTIGKLECFVNGKEIPPQLVESDPEFFNIEIRSDLSENKKCGDTLMTASGYWVFLKPLSEGHYHLSFEGSYQYGKLYSGASYDISVRDNIYSR
jgi:hypothetical protein